MKIENSGTGGVCIFYEKGRLKIGILAPVQINELSSYLILEKEDLLPLGEVIALL